MARKETVEFVDDRDGRSPADETLNFTWEGVAYAIDLTTKNATKMRDQMRPWVEVATKIKTRGRPRKTTRRTSSRSSIPTRIIDESEAPKKTTFGALQNGKNGKNGKNGSSGKPTDKDMRAWAIKEGIEVSPRGRVSVDLKKKYNAAHRAPRKVPTTV